MIVHQTGQNRLKQLLESNVHECALPAPRYSTSSTFQQSYSNSSCIVRKLHCFLFTITKGEATLACPSPATPCPGQPEQCLTANCGTVVRRRRRCCCSFPLAPRHLTQWRKETHARSPMTISPWTTVHHKSIPICTPTVELKLHIEFEYFFFPTTHLPLYFV